MIAGRPVVLLAGCTLTPEVRAEVERLGALVIDASGRDPALTVRHIAHALQNAHQDEPRTNNSMRPPEPPSWAELHFERQIWGRR